MNMSDEFFSVVTAIFLLRGFGITLLIAVFTIFTLFSTSLITLLLFNI